MISKIRVKFLDDPMIWKFLIEPEWEKIKDFRKYLKTVFKLDKIYLLDEDGYLHPNSSINYIRCMSKNNEVLTIKTKVSTSPAPKKTKKNEYLEEISVYNYNENVEINERINGDIDLNTEKTPNLANCKLTSSVFPISNGHFYPKCKDSDVNKCATTENEDYEIPENDFQIKRTKKRKRKKLSLQNMNEVQISNNQNKNDESKDLQYSVVNQNINNPFRENQSESHKSEASKSFHVYFDEKGQAITKRLPKKPQIKFINSLQDLDPVKPRTIKPIIVNLEPKQNDEAASVAETDMIVDTHNIVESYDIPIGPQISAEFLNHKLEKWDSLESGNENGQVTHEDIEINDFSTTENNDDRAIVISNELVNLGVQKSG